LALFSAAAVAALKLWPGSLGTAVTDIMATQDLSLINLSEDAALATSYGLKQTPALQATIEGKQHAFITKRDYGWHVMRRSIRRCVVAHAEAAVAALMNEATFGLRFE
jgi:hypothetical protein